MAQETRIFGVGYALMGAVGATLAAPANAIGDVQSASISVEAQFKDLMNSPEISMYPVLRCFYGSKAELKLSFENLDRSVLGFVTGATSSVNGGQTIMSLTKTTRPGYFRLELHGVDVNNNPVIITCYNASAPGLSLAFSLDDYTKSEITITCFPDANGKVMDIQTTT